MNYRVFLSCKSEDYNTAEALYKFLIDNGVSVFFANESLKRSGNTAYLDEIDTALETCSHMIVFTTKREYAESKFVKEEWQTFRNEKLSGRKKGNLLTIIGGNLTIGDLPLGLRRYEVIPYKSFREIILSYLGGIDIIRKSSVSSISSKSENSSYIAKSDENHDYFHTETQRKNGAAHKKIEADQLNKKSAILHPATERKSVMYEVTIINCNDTRVPIIKILKEILGCSLLESRTFINSLPAKIPLQFDKYQMRLIVNALKGAGATVRYRRL